MEDRLIRLEEVENIRQRDMAALIDMRTPEEYGRFHLPYAINIPYESYEEWSSHLPMELPLILYCSRGNISLYAARKLWGTGQVAYTVVNGISGGKT